MPRSQKSRWIAFLVTVILPLVAIHAQTDKAAQAQAEAQKAIDYMNRNQAEAALAAWDKALALDPNNVPFQYERIVAIAMTKNYKRAIQLLEPIYRDASLLDRGYQLMGNCYDLLDDSSRSLPYYREGLKAYPKSGRLHYELGAAAFIDGNRKEAVDYWLKGTQVEPAFATNYYWLCKAHADRPDKIWAVLYGEIFLMAERATYRTREISKLLFDTWNNALAIGDTTDPINLCSDALLNQPDPRDASAMNFPTAFEYNVAVSAQYLPAPGQGRIPRLSIAQLVSLRARFIRSWAKAGYLEKYPNDLLQWQNTVLEGGWINEYFWWLYSWGDKQEMNDYFVRNEQRYDTFLAWFGERAVDFSKPICVGLGCP